MSNALKRIPALLLLALTILLFQCTPLPVVQKPPVIEVVPDQPVRIVRGDTLNYQIAFSDSRERDRFIYGFDRFLREQSFQTERYDSAGCFTSLKVLPASPQAAVPAPETAPAGTPVVVEQPVESKAAKDTAGAVVSDNARPPSGGSLRIYIPRSSIGEPFSACVNAWPFRESSGDDPAAGCLVVEKVNGTALTMKLAARFTNGTGQVVSALDLVNQWTGFVREHPAEGLALFRRCDGIGEFIKGQEALIRGLQAIDDKTVRVKLSASDQNALDRLRTIRALPATFKLGPYYIKAIRETEHILASNGTFSGAAPFLNECTIRTGGDNNPLVSYSLGRYDAMMLSGSADLDYARRNLLKDGTCSVIMRDRYFIANNLADSSARAYIRSIVSAGDLLKNFVKAEGRPITRIESDIVAGELPAASAVVKPAVAVPIRIVYRKDDLVSKIIAERLLAGITRAGVSGTVAGADEKAYESALVTRSYSCIVGWAPETILTDASEKLRLATMYFNDETDEEARIARNFEIPLFSIDWYLLAKARVGLWQGRVSGLFVKPAIK